MNSLSCFYLPGLGYMIPQPWYQQYLSVPQSFGFIPSSLEQQFIPSFEQPQQFKNSPAPEVTPTEPSSASCDDSSPVKFEGLEQMAPARHTSLGTVFQKTAYFPRRNPQIRSPEESPETKRIKRGRNKIHKKSVAPKYKKKNTQSNISNQVFSFVCSKSKSRPLLVRVLKHNGWLSAKAIGTFYTYMTVVKKNRAKYMNKKVIGELADFPNSCFKEILARNSESSEALSLGSFSATLRTMIGVYLRQMNHLAVITSKKIDRQTTEEHLLRRRQILQYICLKRNE